MVEKDDLELDTESDEDLDIGSDESEGVTGGASTLRTRLTPGPKAGTGDCCFCSPRSA